MGTFQWQLGDKFRDPHHRYSAYLAWSTSRVPNQLSALFFENTYIERQQYTIAKVFIIHQSLLFTIQYFTSTSIKMSITHLILVAFKPEASAEAVKKVRV